MNMCWNFFFGFEFWWWYWILCAARMCRLLILGEVVIGKSCWWCIELLRLHNMIPIRCIIALQFNAIAQWTFVSQRWQIRIVQFLKLCYKCSRSPEVGEAGRGDGGAGRGIYTFSGDSISAGPILKWASDQIHPEIHREHNRQRTVSGVGGLSEVFAFEVALTIPRPFKNKCCLGICLYVSMFRCILCWMFFSIIMK